ncbi:MAG: glucose-6-phosphate dehydrogenase [Armatimonadetes bacterium]|nr:glucose-6-phosphate dehydrogenase [Armatimonadota bacterium]
MAPREVEPHLFVIMGGSGALARRKLLPAVWQLAAQGSLTAKSIILATARRRHLDDESYRQWAREALAAAGLPADETCTHWCDECLHYHALGEEGPEDFQALRSRIEALERQHDLPGNRVFYLAIPPASLPLAVEGLGAAGLHRAPGWTRIVVEKPFGHDLESANELDRLLKRYFSEEQTYRIDHYLGKEAVQNLLVFRFANPVFESLWSRDRIASVQITVAETAGIEDRAAFYDGVGALRDMVQNHMMQLLTLVAMEIPASFEADAIRNEKAKVLQAVAPIRQQGVCFGQYVVGEIDGIGVPGYLDAAGVQPASSTETFVALELNINNWRWQGVPFYLRTGKRLAKSTRQIVVNFRCPVLSVFDRYPDAAVSANSLVITLEPDEGFELEFVVKAPGDMLTLQPQRLRFRYDEVFGRLPEAYEALLLDILTGDQTLFVRIDEVLAAWRLLTPLLEMRPRPYPYAAGTWGPREADSLLAPVGGVCWLNW